MRLIPRCPKCGEHDLQLAHRGAMDYWVCPGSHGGLAISFSELHERAQEDEIHQIWRLAKTGPEGPLTSPFADRKMVRVTVGFDPDEIEEGLPGDLPDEGRIEVDVDLDSQFLWFDEGELDQLPKDLPDAKPTPAQRAEIRRMMEELDRVCDAAIEAEEDQALTERLYDWLVRHPDALRVATSLARKMRF